MKKNGRRPDKDEDTRKPLLDLDTREGRQSFKQSIIEQTRKKARQAELDRIALSESLKEDRKARKK